MSKRTRAHWLIFGFAAATLVLATGCRTFDVRTDWDPGHGFDGMARFFVVDPPEVEGANPFADNGLLRKRVRHTVSAVLTERGYQLVEAREEADFLVTWSVMLEERLRVNGVSSGAGIGWARRPFGYGAIHTSSSIRPYQESTLIIDFLDPGSDELVWRGWGTGIVGTRDRKRDHERLAEGIAAILDAFPPETGDDDR